MSSLATRLMLWRSSVAFNGGICPTLGAWHTNAGDIARLRRDSFSRSPPLLRCVEWRLSPSSLSRTFTRRDSPPPPTHHCLVLRRPSQSSHLPFFFCTFSLGVWAQSSFRDDGDPHTPQRKVPSLVWARKGVDTVARGQHKYMMSLRWMTDPVRHLFSVQHPSTRSREALRGSFSSRCDASRKIGVDA